ncbi:MAG: hypothetical protein ABMA13_07370 [Chthoniobacteraceae bacterium]
MKVNVPGTILATSLNIGAMVNAGLPQGTASGGGYADETKQASNTSSGSEVVSVSDITDEFYSTVQEIPVEMEWDKAAEKRFQSLAVKEALETSTVSERVELEQLTLARRKHTAPAISGDEVLEELRQWQSVNRVFEALNRYVQEIGLPRATFTNRS